MRNTFRNLIILFGWAACSFGMSAAEPNGYYASCLGKSGATLLSQLESVVGNHTDVHYDGLWSLYQTTDVHSNGKIWDMYSTKEWTYKSEQCGSYKNVGDCYNREHSMPKSWFDDASPMISDAFHIYPTDGKVNGQRSNYPYGECSGGTTLPGNGSVKALGRLGKSTVSGYSGTVFEPDDEYKGDFARSYFYMAAAYNSRIKTWDSDMLANNSYPAFTTWAIDVLLKWHRQDPVSQKEIDRNEAVYKAQKNRNPFIDHPELAEHIWGDKKTTGWNEAMSQPELLLPVNNSTVDLGTTMVGVSRSATITVKGVSLEGVVSFEISGLGFSVSTESVQASAVNTTSGYSLTVIFNPKSSGTFTGMAEIIAGNLSTVVTLKGKAVDSLPAGPVTGVSDDSFEAVWSFVGDDNNGAYSLDVLCDNRSIAGYPKNVDADAERYVVEGLEPSTKYAYTVSSNTHKSQLVEVTTLDPIPSVVVLFDGNLIFSAAPGYPSEAAELLLEIDNISTDITLSVIAPFQLSDDKTNWTSEIKISPDQDRVYLRLFSDNTGTYTGTLLITAGQYRNDDVDFTGTVASGLFEDFEAPADGFSNYNGGIYQGSAAKWRLSNAGIYSSDPTHGGNQAVRFGKSGSESALEMQDNTNGGVGTVTLWARNWSDSEAKPTIALEYSVDNGATWKSAGSANINDATYRQFTFTVNSTSSVRLRVRRTAGARLLIDDIEASAYSNALVPEAVADYHRWDAFCRDGLLIVEASESVNIAVYALDGTTLFEGEVSSGEFTLQVAKGLYIVACDGFGRRVLVK